VCTEQGQARGRRAVYRVGREKMKDRLIDTPFLLSTVDGRPSENLKIPRRTAIAWGTETVCRGSSSGGGERGSPVVAQHVGGASRAPSKLGPNQPSRRRIS
jgi:hypothetical protein